MAGTEEMQAESDELEILTGPPDIEPDEEQSHGEAEEIPDDYYFGRYGTFMLITSADAESVPNLRDRLEEAIRNDNRIVDALPVSINEEWIHGTVVYPRRNETTDEALLSSGDATSAIRFRAPIVFTVKIPIKNQPLFHNENDIPTDTYYAAWDGITATVLWKREPENLEPPRSGGHIVIDVLQDIAKAMGLHLYVQACGPGCTNGFAHPVMRIERVRDSEERFSVRGFDNYNNCVNIHMHGKGSPQDLVAGIALTTGGEGESFAIYKNYARRILDLEICARSMVDELLALRHARIARSRLSVAKRIRESWVQRSNERKVRLLMSSLWLAFARIEALRMDWLQTRRRFNDLLGRFHYGDLYETDRGDDDEAIMSQDLSVIGGAVDQTATRMDARALAWTTALVALAGLIGAVIGGIATALLSSH